MEAKHNPTNGELALMIKSLRELMEVKFSENAECHKRVDKHLTELNGKVIKNTQFRVRWAGAYISISVLMTVVGISSGVLVVVKFFI